jgi:8-oxo-dGTP diphosphatase
MRREIGEEAGIACDRLELAGTVSWPGFGRDGETGSVADLLAGKLPVWAGDAYFLPLVFGSTGQFHAVMPYAGGRPTGWSYTQL